MCGIVFLCVNLLGFQCLSVYCNIYIKKAKKMRWMDGRRRQCKKKWQTEIQDAAFCMATFSWKDQNWSLFNSRQTKNINRMGFRQQTAPTQRCMWVGGGGELVSSSQFAQRQHCRGVNWVNWRMRRRVNSWLEQCRELEDQDVTA